MMPSGCGGTAATVSDDEEDDTSEELDTGGQPLVVIHTSFVDVCAGGVWGAGDLSAVHLLQGEHLSRLHVPLLSSHVSLFGPPFGPVCLPSRISCPALQLFVAPLDTAARKAASS